MIEKLQKMREEKSEDGFTLIELLVVVVIIGILIAIAIPLYLNYTKGAENKSAASDVRGGISTIEQCYSDSNSSYPASIALSGNAYTPDPTTCKTPNATINVSSGNTLSYYPSGTNFVPANPTANLPAQGSASSYILVGSHGTNGVWYCYNSAVGGSVKTETASTLGTFVPTNGC